MRERVQEKFGDRVIELFISFSYSYFIQIFLLTIDLLLPKWIDLFNHQTLYSILYCSVKYPYLFVFKHYQEACDRFIRGCFVCLEKKDEILQLIKSEKFSSVEAFRNLKSMKFNELSITDGVDPRYLAKDIAKSVTRLHIDFNLIESCFFYCTLEQQLNQPFYKRSETRFDSRKFGSFLLLFRMFFKFLLLYSFSKNGKVNNGVSPVAKSIIVLRP